MSTATIQYVERFLTESPSGKKLLRAAVKLALRIIEEANPPRTSDGKIIVYPRELEPVLGRPKSVIKRYMAKLAEYGVAKSRMEGNRTVYILDPDKLKELANALPSSKELNRIRDKARRAERRNNSENASMIAELHRMLETAREEREQLMRKLEEYRKLVEQLTKEKEEAIKKYAELVKRLKTENEKLRSEVETLKSKLAKKDELLRRAKKIIEELKSKPGTSRDKRLEEENRELKRKIALLEAENRNLRNRVKELEGKVKSLEDEVMTLRMRLGLVGYRPKHGGRSESEVYGYEYGASENASYDFTDSEEFG